MKKIILVVFFFIVFLLGFYFGNWVNNKKKLEDEALYFIKINNIYQAILVNDLQEVNDSIGMLIKVHINRYLNARGYSVFTEREDRMFCDGVKFSEIERDRFVDFVNKQKLNESLSNIDFCKFDFIQHQMK